MRLIVQLTVGALSFYQTTPSAQHTPATHSAFESGKTHAEQGRKAAVDSISHGAPAQYIEHYQQDVPETDFYQGGKYGIDSAGKNKLANCRAGGAGAPLKEQECDAVNFISRNKGKRSLFDRDPKTDPTVQGSKKIINNAQSVAGRNPAGSAQQCRVEHVTSPATNIEETCTESQIVGRQSCSKTLRVDVRLNCEPNQLFPVLDMPRSHIDHIHIFAKCDMAALNNDYLEMTADAFGNLGGEVRNQTVRVPKNIGSLAPAALQMTHGRGPALLVATTRPHWEGSIRSVPVYVLPDSPGCAPGSSDCRYHFYWEWVELRRGGWGRSGTPEILSSNEGWATGVMGEIHITDHWDDQCGNLASRTGNTAN